ncbi:MAG TPA: ABC transporter ATP-binding protein [bacterium]|nr:ABC transporter ATP-binding protein [bacterium]
MTTSILETHDLKKYYPVTKGLFSRVTGHVRAVDGVTISVPAGRTLGLVGESGCGKTTLGRLAIRLLDPDGGRIMFDGADITAMKQRALRPLRRKMQIIFQDPYGSLNPRFTVIDIVGEGLKVFSACKTAKEYRERVVQLLEMVGLSGDILSRYPHEFSGGQRQRLGIARALALDPRFIVCDEPVSSLDVSVQAQIINLLADIQKKLGLSYLFISHDLSVVYHISDFVAVMYLGKIVEYAPGDELYANPLHPYTRALLAAVPVIDPATGAKKLILEKEEPLSRARDERGCSFRMRCPFAKGECAAGAPRLEERRPGHFVSCLFSGKV